MEDLPTVIDLGLDPIVDGVKVRGVDRASIMGVDASVELAGLSLCKGAPAELRNVVLVFSPRETLTDRVVTISSAMQWQISQEAGEITTKSQTTLDEQKVSNDIAEGPGTVGVMFYWTER